MGILDTINLSQQNAALRTFNPQAAILEHLQSLKEREREILVRRHGLSSAAEPQTLEAIGRQFNLTRERVRQLEKDALKKLSVTAPGSSLQQAISLIFQIIEAHGDIMREKALMDTLLLPEASSDARNALGFLLNLIPRFQLFPETKEYHKGWVISGFDQRFFHDVISQATLLLAEKKKPATAESFLEELQKKALGKPEDGLNQTIFENYLSASKKVARNAYEEWGLTEWPEITPKDIGDKIRLVLLHHGRPEHYARITELINKQRFDHRQANKETVHNELIKDSRFLLVGRGIYALKDWGYKPGVVSDVISDVLRAAGRPLTRDEIIAEVLKQRIVKRNTILVSLSKKTLFKKTTDNKYANV